MKRKRIPKKVTDDVSSNEFVTKKNDSTVVDSAVEQTSEKTLNTWEMKLDSPGSDEDLNAEKTLNTWEMVHNPAEDLNDAEDSQTFESDDNYTESDSENTGYQFI